MKLPLSWDVFLGTKVEITNQVQHSAMFTFAGADGSGIFFYNGTNPEFIPWEQVSRVRFPL